MADDAANDSGAFERLIYITPAEYERGLRLAYPDGVVGSGTEFTVTDGAASLRISLSPGDEVRIALMRLPTLTARLQFVDGGQDDRERLLRHLDLAMQKGGG